MNELENLRQENEILRGILNIPKVDNDATAFPFWLIIIPKQIMKKDIDALAYCIVGLFFSRESAQQHLDARRYEYGDDARVYCHSGHYSNEYKQLVKNANSYHGDNSNVL